MRVKTTIEMNTEEIAGSSKSDKEDNSSKHDLQSESFDAHSSLASDTSVVQLPVPNAHTFNNIDEYFNKSFNKLKPLQSKKSSKALPTIERTLKVELCASSRPKRQELPTVLTRMKGALRGPNNLLLKCLNKRIKVMIRRRKGVKLFSERFGWVSGLLIAFDKHYNLCMTDVDEKYQRLDQNNETIDIFNHIKQLFIRGDNVVLIGFV